MAAISAREFNQYTGRAKTMANKEPVFITERGTVKYVLLNIEEYEQAIAPKRTLFDSLAMNEAEYFHYEFVRIPDEFKEVDFQ